MKSLLIILFSALNFMCFSQNKLAPVVWSATYIQKSKSEGEIVFKAIIEKNWHIYSQRATDVGPIPTSFTVVPNSKYELIGKVEENEAHEEFVPAFDAKIFVFSNEADFTQKIVRKTKEAFVVNASLEFMTCNNSQCLPPAKIDFTIIIPEQ